MYMPRSESLSKLHSHVRNTLDCYTRLSHKNYTTNKDRSLDTEINEQILWFSINSKGNNSSQGWTDWHYIFSESCSKWFVSLFWRMSNGNWKLIIYDILYYVHYAPFLRFHFFAGVGGLPLPSSNANFKLIFKSTTNLSLFKDNQCPLFISYSVL